MSRQTPKPTTPEDWTRSDQYHNSFLLAEDQILDAVLENSSANGLPDIAVSAAQGKFLSLLASSIGAKKILEVGTLGGYSTIWLARALPADGELITLEYSEKHAKVAQENIERAGLSSKVKIMVGLGHDSLLQLHPDIPFDLVFIDADKPSNVKYFTEAKRLVRKGGVIIVDNVVRYARVADPEYTSPNVEGVRDLLKAIKGDTEVDATTIATVGDKGYDGFFVCYSEVEASKAYGQYCSHESVPHLILSSARSLSDPYPLSYDPALDHMSQLTTPEDWARSDQYHNSFLLEDDAILDAALKNSTANGLPEAAVSAAQGKFLRLLASSIGAKRILEVGTLGGYSAIWLARALPADGELITLECNEKHAKVAQENIARAELSSKIKIIVGLGHESMLQLHPDIPFDLVFIDADKQSNMKYFTEAKRLVCKGGIVDNVVRDGKVSNPEYTDASVEGVRALLQAIEGDAEVDATTIATVGEKGYDGFLYAIRK
ncbi:tRNA threonylcarbamoyladenosine dehydratase [Mycena venus]|uniref:tRNA threonylcarbamoyladenosine dehydratase n=1 Tax=Mycena venus TaxID=2733690 RepID=A0A8H6U3L6_9AGAR|nr:tRNA threonylcarbamoyladenosine dehydratase [Mycena venus]